MEYQTKIKICGLKRPEDVAMVNRWRPDYAGFVFAGTKRKISKELAAQLKAALAPEIRSVGVFVREPLENIAAMCREGILDMVQLHGDEPEEYIGQVRALTGKPVISAVRVRDAQDIIARAGTCADYLLLDTYRKDEYGGSGESFCWEELAAAKEELGKNGRILPSFFLAGGLNAGNAAEAVRLAKPFALDVSSGVETDGCKDEVKIREFIGAVRRMEEQTMKGDDTL